ncbi:MAG: hypothetical protein IPN55_15250 [Saprospiraceae bacterium]|nr:hypothetical protein [Candidatus Brachybacter algidus]
MDFQKLRWLNFFNSTASPGNAGKSVDQSDPQFEIEVRKWQVRKES